MSFSSEVKEELSGHISPARHCQIAELAAMVCFAGELIFENHEVTVIFRFESRDTAEKCRILINKLTGYRPEIEEKGKTFSRGNYEIHISDQAVCLSLAKTVKQLDYWNSFLELEETTVLKEQSLPWNDLLLQKNCCKRAFLRGVFLSAGSVNNPEKAYHFEIVTDYDSIAQKLKKLLLEFELDARIVKRKKYYVVYMKEGEMIVDVLNIMEAYLSLMNMENVRILKEVRNTVNRQVNCETANLNKTVNAARKQIEEIEYLVKMKKLDKLSPQLKELAELRLEEPDASMAELGKMLSPPVGKSGVNHRLRKICTIAEETRKSNIF